MYHMFSLIVTVSKETLKGGAERWLTGEEHMLLLQKTQFSSQHSHGDSDLSVTLATGDPTPTLTSEEDCAYTCMQNSHIHKIKIKKLK